MNRRGFLKALVAPAIILTPGLLMPVRSFGSVLSFVQSGTGASLSYAAILHGDGFHDDTAGLQAFMNGEPVLYNGALVQDRLGFGTFLITRQINVAKPGVRVLHDSTIIGNMTNPNDAMLYFPNTASDGGFALRSCHLARSDGDPHG